MSAEPNAPPRTGWANIVTELHVADLAVSLVFWKDILGFDIAYRRDEEKFVYLEHPEGQQIMLCQRHGRFETGPMQPPLGQGAMFQIYFKDIGAILTKESIGQIQGQIADAKTAALRAKMNGTSTLLGRVKRKLKNGLKRVLWPGRGIG